MDHLSTMAKSRPRPGTQVGAIPVYDGAHEHSDLGWVVRALTYPSSRFLTTFELGIICCRVVLPYRSACQREVVK